MHCAKSLLTGEPAEGYWFDQTQEYAARRRGEPIPETSKEPRFSGDVFAHASVLKGAATTGRA